MVNEMSEVLKQYNLTIDDYKVLCVRLDGIVGVLKAHSKQQTPPKTPLEYFVHDFFAAKTGFAMLCKGDYKMFGPNEFVDLLLFLDREEVADFSVNIKNLREELRRELEKYKTRLLEEGKPQENVSAWASESKLFLSQPNYLEMLSAIIREDVKEKLIKEGLIGE
jgi:hypothetical protein